MFYNTNFIFCLRHPLLSHSSSLEFILNDAIHIYTRMSYGDVETGHSLSFIQLSLFHGLKRLGSIRTFWRITALVEVSARPNIVHLLTAPKFWEIKGLTLEKEKVSTAILVNLLNKYLLILLFLRQGVESFIYKSQHYYLLMSKEKDILDDRSQTPISFIWNPVLLSFPRVFLLIFIT